MTDDPAASKATYACPTCGLEYSRMEYLRRHQRSVTKFARPPSAILKPLTESTPKIDHSNVKIVRRTLLEGTCNDRKYDSLSNEILSNRSDVLLRHRRRCHPEEQAALELSPTTTTTPPSRAKEPVVKPKPRQVAQPYPVPPPRKVRLTF